MKTRAENLEEKAGRAPEREPVPIVVTVFHREEDTRKMFEQLARVTNNYSLIIVNNGFDDPDFLRSLNPLHYIENEENTGAIRPINQGLEVAEGEYIAVLHSDLLIYDEGWLDHIVDFLDRRPDVGLVGLRGQRTVGEDGSLGDELPETKYFMHYDNPKPPFRFTEVATIDGIGWVMRNMGLRLDEGLGLMHFCACHLSLQYIEEGHKVYMGAVDFMRLFGGEAHSPEAVSMRTDGIGIVSGASCEKARDMLRSRWEHKLPITRGFSDERRYYQRIDELDDEIKHCQVSMEEFARESVRLLEDIKAKDDEIKKAAERSALIEEENKAKTAELESVSRYREELEAALSTKNYERSFRLSGEPSVADNNVKLQEPAPSVTQDSPLYEKFRFYLKSEGFLSTIRRVKLFLRRNIGQSAKRG